MRVLALTGIHDRQGFDCGRHELNDWLQRVARQHQDKGLSKTFVAACEDNPDQIRDYYALTLAELENQHLPETHRRKLPRRVPGVRLGRLAVDRRFQNRGLGELLLVDALTRAQRIHVEAGGNGLFVDALDKQATSYCQRLGFEAAPDNPLLLFLSSRVASAISDPATHVAQVSANTDPG